MTEPLEIARQVYQDVRAKLLEQMPELANDEECLLDTLEGLTNVNELLAELVRSAVNDEMMADGIAEYQAKLADRKSILAARALRKRRLVLHYMEDLNLKRLAAPDMTIVRKNVPPAVMILDEAAIPDELMRIKREPNKTAIREALLAGRNVTGATMSNGSETLFVKI